MFRRMFGGKIDPLMEQADILVQAASINAITAFTPMLDEFAFLREADPKHWDFVLTIAGVFMALTRLRNLRLGERRERKLSEKVCERLAQWNPANGIRGFEHCKAFFERNFDALARAGDKPRFTASDTIGSWIVWDVLGRPPQSEDERRLVRTIGALVTHAFFNWWDEKTTNV